jgi:hypothetical protein
VAIVNEEEYAARELARFMSKEEAINRAKQVVFHFVNRGRSIINYDLQEQFHYDEKYESFGAYRPEVKLVWVRRQPPNLTDMVNNLRMQINPSITGTKGDGEQEV